MDNFIKRETTYGAHNYAPLPVVLTKAKGVYVWDHNGKRYIDMMSAYSAVSHGHCHPKLVAALTEQANTLAVTSRAYYSDQLGFFLEKLCKMTGMDKALPMNSGAEAVETAIKAARKWGHTVKKIPENQAEIIVCESNFHGRTTTIISMSTEPQYRYGFGPYTPGFKIIPFNNIDALEKAITPNTAAFLVEPIQGEGGIIVPDPAYLKKAYELCKKNNVLFIADEIQSGLGRTGKLLACEHDNVKPDGLILGKALGGGLLAVSAFLAREEVMAVFTPGDHGSTFGGNALAARVGFTALSIIEEEKLVQRSEELGEYFIKKLRTIQSPLITDIRGKGLWIGVEIDPKRAPARQICLKLMELGVLSKETHEKVVRLAPPLVIDREQLDDAFEKIKQALM